MIVECDQCSTRFQLDEERIPARGIRVRCSRCKHAFFLKNPAVSQSEAFDEVAAEAAGAAAPDPTQDLEPRPPQGTNGLADSSDDEEDWEFNHDAPADRDERFGDEFDMDHADVSGELDDDDSRETAYGEVPGLCDDEPPGLADADSLLELPGEDEADFGSMDDFESLSRSPGEGETAPDTSPSASAASSMAHAAVDGLLDSSPADEELGDPENWDFFSEDAAPHAAMAAPVALPTASDPTVVSTPDAMAVPGDSLDAYVPTPARYDRLGSWLATAGHAVGWTITAALLATGAVRGIFPEFQPIAGQRTEGARVGELRVASVESHWIETAHAGKLLAVEGMLHNASPSGPREIGALQVALLDERGRRLDLAPATAGHPLDEDALRQLPAAHLWSLQAEASRDLTAGRVDPRSSQAFAALFSDVPHEARRFVVEPIAESETATEQAAVGDADAALFAPVTNSDRPEGVGLANDAAQAIDLAPMTEASPR